MKNNFSKILGLFALGGLTFFQSCTEDDGTTTGGTTESPSLTLVSGTGFLTGDATVEPGDTALFRVTAAKGEENLKSFTIREDGTNIPQARLIFDGVPASANPKLIADVNEQNTFTMDVGIIVPNETGQSYQYQFQVSDDVNLSDSKTVTLTTDSQDTLNVSTTTSKNAVIDSDNFDFALMAEASAGFKELTVYVDDRMIGADSLLSISGDSTFGANPLALTGNMFSDTIRVTLGRGQYSVKFEFTDQRDSVASETFTIDTRIQSDLELFSNVKIWNAAGPNFGGLDLDAADSVQAVSSLEAEFEIKDAGIDGGATGENWKQQIVPAQGVTIKPVPSSSELTFDNASTHASLETAYGNLSGEITSAGSSAVLVQGDTFIVKKGTNYFIIRIESVNTDANNEDYFEISAKRKV